MHVRTEHTFSVFDLFVRDFEFGLTLNPRALAHAPSAALREHTGDVNWAVRSPADSGVSYFTLAHGETCWAKRCDSTQEVRALLPLPVVEFLRLVDKGDWTLTYESVTDRVRRPRLVPTLAK